MKVIFQYILRQRDPNLHELTTRKKNTNSSMEEIIKWENTEAFIAFNKTEYLKKYA